MLEDLSGLKLSLYWQKASYPKHMGKIIDVLWLVRTRRGCSEAALRNDCNALIVNKGYRISTAKQLSDLHFQYENAVWWSTKTTQGRLCPTG